MAQSSTIQIKVGGVEVTCHGPVDHEQLEDVLRTLKSQLGPLMQAGAENSSGPTATDLLARSEARTFGEKAGVIAYWLERYAGRTGWRSADIVDAMRDAGEATPANITDALNQKLRKGLFEVHDRRWRLTGEGRGWVKYRLLNEENGEG